MKHLLKFNESVKNKLRVLNSVTVRSINKFIEDCGLTCTDSSSLSNYDVVINNQKNNVRLSFKKQDDRILFTEEFRSKFVNRVVTRPKNVIEIEISEYSDDDNNFIVDYMDDIEDSLLYLTDMGFSLKKDYGELYPEKRNEINVYPAYKTAVSIFIRIEGEHLKAMNSFERMNDYINRVKSTDIYGNTMSSIKRIQSLGLRVVFNFYNLDNLQFLIVSKEDRYYNTIPLL